MGAFIAGIKLLIANIIFSIVMFIAQLGLFAVLSSDSMQQHMETLSSDPASATALPGTFLALLIGFVLFAVLFQGYIVNRLWGWD